MGTSQYLLGELSRYVRTLRQQSVAGWDLDIVTAVLPDHESAGFDLDGCPTVRVGNQYGFPWRRKSFSGSATRAIANRKTIPAAIMLMDMDDQVAEFRSGQRTSTRVIVRYDSALESGSLARAFSQRRIARSLAMADEIWTANRWQLDSLRLLGLPAENVRLVPDCVMPTDVDLPERRDNDNAAIRQAARKSLCSVYDGLKNAMNDPLVVCAVPMNLPQAMTSLMDTWRLVVREMPSAILWMVGDSVRSRDVVELAQQLDLDGNVCFPGAFDCLDDVFAAANLLIHPAKTDEFAINLLTGMRTGRAALATWSESPMERWLQDGENVFLMDAFEPKLSAKRIVELLDQQEALDQVGVNARRDVAIHRHPRLFFETLNHCQRGNSSMDQYGAAQ